MTKREQERIARQEQTLVSLGFTIGQAQELRRISMTLRRWYEQECGDSNEYGSWAIERDDNGDGKPYHVHHHYRHGKGPDTVTRTPIADREAGAIKRLKAIFQNHRDRQTPSWPDGVAVYPNPLAYYLQTDPRGASLYIIRPGDVPEGMSVESCYNRGIVVY